jgi:two-component system, NtrC family, response regulator HydG
MSSILIVDDLVSIHEMLEAVVAPTGLNTVFATDGEQALVKYKAQKFDLVLADVDMKPMDGITLLKQLKVVDPTSVVIIMTAYASTESAIQALKFGAFDYLQKPFKVDELIKTLKRALEYRQFSQEQDSAGTPTIAPPTSAGDIESQIVGHSPATVRLVQQLKKLVSAKNAVLLQGEVGTGKRQVAELLHNCTNAGAPFVRVDCTHSNDSDFCDNLIGEKGGGGAWAEEAKGGTLFLDNIPSLPLDIQQKLVGVLKALSGSVRLICSSTVDLEAQIDEGNFDDELFYRVASLPVVLPPLRERVEDIPALVKDIVLRTANPSFASSQIEFTDDALHALAAHYWPGNISELNQVISKIVATSETRVISSRQLPMRLREMTDWASLADYLAGQEKEYISTVMNACKDDKALALKILKCDPSKLG